MSPPPPDPPPDPQPDPPLDPPLDPVSQTLRETAGALRAATESVVRPLGLSLAQYSCLAVLGRDPGASGADVARATHVTRQSVHVLLRSMELEGLVERGRSVGRALSWRPTPLGRQRLCEAEAEVRRLDAAVLRPLDGTRRQLLRGLLEACADSLDRAAPPGGPA